MNWELIKKRSVGTLMFMHFKVGNYFIKIVYDSEKLNSADISADKSIRFLPEIYCDIDDIRNRLYSFTISAYAARALDEKETKEMMARIQEAIELINELGETDFNCFL